MINLITVRYLPPIIWREDLIWQENLSGPGMTGAVLTTGVYYVPLPETSFSLFFRLSVQPITYPVLSDSMNNPPIAVTYPAAAPL